MQTIINLKPSELNQGILDKVKEFLQGSKSASITITINEEDDYLENLTRSIAHAEENKEMITFTFEEFVAYDPKKGK